VRSGGRSERERMEEREREKRWEREECRPVRSRKVAVEGGV